MSQSSPGDTRLLPGDWHHVADELPPRGLCVEARVSLSKTRTLILNVTWLEADAAAVSWLNSTTGGPLHEGWRPVEWRYAARSDALVPSAAPAPKRA
ncbi:MAG TPA: hypothetical protein VMU67_12705 [Steroidobacteraceae bacterium]|nr:hypothetical protein [Steroidobacteraceae bacterium]